MGLQFRHLVRFPTGREKWPQHDSDVRTAGVPRDPLTPAGPSWPEGGSEIGASLVDAVRLSSKTVTVGAASSPGPSARPATRPRGPASSSVSTKASQPRGRGELSCLRLVETNIQEKFQTLYVYPLHFRALDLLPNGPNHTVTRCKNNDSRGFDCLAACWGFFIRSVVLWKARRPRERRMFWHALICIALSSSILWRGRPPTCVVRPQGSGPRTEGDPGVEQGCSDSPAGFFPWLPICHQPHMASLHGQHSARSA